MWRRLASAVVLLGNLGLVHAQTVPLAEAPLPKSCFRVELTMNLTGKITVQQEGKNVALKQTASARLDFLERILEATGPGGANQPGASLGDKTARLYQSGEAVITIDNDVVKRSLRPEHALMLAQRTAGQLLTYCPHGLLTTEEKELTEHFDTLALPGLLPGADVAVGADWTIPNGAVLALCDVDALVSGNLTGKLVKVQGDVAEGSVEGIVKGIGMGAQVTMEVKARFAFELKEKRIIAVEWQQHEERLQGPINPACTADVIYKIKRTPIIQPNELSEIALVRALAVPADKMSNIVYRDPSGRFELQHARSWRLVSQDDKHVVLRLLSDRGDFVAQATLTPYATEAPGRMMDIDEFARLMAEAPGWEQEETLLEKSAKVDVAADSGFKVYRVGATGKLAGVPAIQYFHLVTGLGGDQLLVTFTMDPKQAPNLSPHDLTLLRGITFPTLTARTTSNAAQR
jgi:hypothetical protein